MYQVTVIPTFY